MSVQENICVGCGKHRAIGEKWEHITLGKDPFAICSPECYGRAKIEAQKVLDSIDDAVVAMREKATDETFSYKVSRWWSQFYKHRRKALDQWKIEREFKRIQRQEQRRSR